MRMDGDSLEGKEGRSRQGRGERGGKRLTVEG
jgi:hypothetical protein